jgi:hypothetical protein
MVHLALLINKFYLFFVLNRAIGNTRPEPLITLLCVSSRNNNYGRSTHWQKPKWAIALIFCCCASPAPNFIVTIVAAVFSCIAPAVVAHNKRINWMRLSVALVLFVAHKFISVISFYFACTSYPSVTFTGLAYVNLTQQLPQLKLLAFVSAF